MDTISFQDCIKAKSRFSKACEEYFFLDGITTLLGGRTFKVLSENQSTTKLYQKDTKPLSIKKTAATCAKLLSYLIPVIPLIMLIGKIHYRNSHRFKIVIAPNPQVPPPPTVPIPQEPSILANNMLSKAERISVSTYNILFPQSVPPNQFSTKIGYSVDKNGNLYDNIDFRMNIIRDNILKSNLDVICLQELTQATFNTLRTDLAKDYDIFWGSHFANRHGVGILYKKHKFTRLKMHTFDLRVPVPATNNPNITYNKPRAQMLVDLQDKTTQKIFRVVTGHFIDPRDLTDKTLHTKQVVDYVENNAGHNYTIDRTIIAGDMNQDQFGDMGAKPPTVPGASHASAFQPFFSNQYYVDNNLDSTYFAKATFDDGPIFSKKRRIDWIWSKHFAPEYLPLENLDIRGSDHLLVAATIR